MGGEETYGVYDEVVHEPRGGDSEEPDPVALDNQPVGNLRVLHRIALEPLGLLHVYPPEQDGECREGTETKGETEDSSQVIRTAAMIQR
jgi:hypothetical protein